MDILIFLQSTAVKMAKSQVSSKPVHKKMLLYFACLGHLNNLHSYCLPSLSSAPQKVQSAQLFQCNYAQNVEKNQSLLCL